MRVAFLGLGAMGAPMAAHLADAHVCYVWNRTKAVAEQHAAAHGSVCVASAATAAAAADVCFVCLPTSAVVAAVLQAVELRPGCVVVDATSGEPDASRALAADLAARGARYVDAPVSGGPRGAAAGTLTTMVGGDADTVAEVTPLLRAYARRVVHVGPVGSAHAIKAVNNLLNVGGLLLASEGLVALRRLGVDPEAALAAINGSSGRSLMTQERLPQAVLTRRFDYGFALGLMRKDVRIAMGMLQGRGDVAAAVAELVDAACEREGLDADYTRAVCEVERRGGARL